MTPTFLAAALAAFAPHLTPTPLAPAAVLPPDAQWAAAAATVRVSGGPTGPVASAVCLEVKGGAAFLLTAGHAVPPGEGRLYAFFDRQSWPQPAGETIGGEVLVRLAECDVALVKVAVRSAAPAAAPLAPPGARPKRFPASAAAVGCPDGLPPWVRAETVVGKAFDPRRKPGDAQGFFWETATPPKPGMSGGPLLDGRGRVIGICTAAQGGKGYYAHLDEIHAGLIKAGYGWLVTPGEPKP